GRAPPHADLRPRAAGARHDVPGPGDRDGVRRDDGRAARLRGARRPVLQHPHQPVPVGELVATTVDKPRIAEIPTDVEVDPVTLTSDPFKCSASISHTNDWLVLVPIFHEDELVGWSSQFGHQMDCGGPLPGSLPTAAKTIFEEGLIIPPVKILERGEVQGDVL